MNDRRQPDGSPEPEDRLVSHPPILAHGKDVYPPELLAAALANGITTGDDEPPRVIHILPPQSGADVYPPELLAAARANEAEPVGALGLTVRLPAGVTADEAAADVFELVRALSDYDVAIGGAGLVVDRERSRVDGSELALLLRPRDARHSLGRCRKMADLLAGAGPPQPFGVGDLFRDPAEVKASPEASGGWVRTSRGRLPHGVAVTVQLLKV